jgi:superfamily II DNA/RNA helicase
MNGVASVTLFLLPLRENMQTMDFSATMQNTAIMSILRSMKVTVIKMTFLHTQTSHATLSVCFT